MGTIKLDRFIRAQDSLKKGYKPNPSELERDGIIQRFEYTLELCWKTAKKILLINGIEVDTPKNVVRELGVLGWVEKPEDWLDYIDKGNQTSHLYNEEVAAEIFAVVHRFIKDVDNLLLVLEEKSK